jgi:hypothetical protein
LSLDVFLESGDGFDREAAEAALARTGIAADSIVTTADGGEASLSVDDDGAAFVIRALTPELVDVIFDVAAAIQLAILPADGTPTAFVAGDASVPDELEPVDVADAGELFTALRHSEELRGAREA